MGADAPRPQNTMNAAAPVGPPPRRFESGFLALQRTSVLTIIDSIKNEMGGQSLSALTVPAVCDGAVSPLRGYRIRG